MKKKELVKKTKAIKNLEQADKIVAEIGRCENDVNKIIVALNDRIKKAEAKTAPLRRKINALCKNLVKFNLKNEGVLGRIIKGPNGEFGTRWGNPSVEFLTDEDAVILEMEQKNFSEFIRTVKEVDKIAMLRNREEIGDLRTVAIVRKRFFFVKPKGIKLTESKDLTRIVGRKKL